MLGHITGNNDDHIHQVISDKKFTFPPTDVLGDLVLLYGDLINNWYYLNATRKKLILLDIKSVLRYLVIM